MLEIAGVYSKSISTGGHPGPISDSTQNTQHLLTYLLPSLFRKSSSTALEMHENLKVRTQWSHPTLSRRKRVKTATKTSKSWQNIAKKLFKSSFTQ